MSSIKSRFTATDVKAMVRDLRSTLLGQRVANVYDLTDKIYLFKFAIPGSSEKLMLLLESGVRFHTTKYARDKNDMPSPFAMKLRKFIRTKRLEDIRQLGSDRVVDFKFGSGESVCHIILELYASGNIVLTDGAYEIQALLRSHQFSDDVAVKMHEIYPIAFTTSLDSLSINSLSNESSQSILNMDKTQFIEWASQRDRLNDENQNNNNPNNPTTDNNNNNNNQEKQSNDQEQKSQNQNEKNEKKNNSGGNKKNKVKKLTLKQLFLSKESGIASYGPEIIENCILTSGLLPSTKVFEILQVDSSQYLLIDNLLGELKNGSNLLTLLNTPGQPGYILTRQKKVNNNNNNNSQNKKNIDDSENTGNIENKGESVEFYDFIPRRFLQHDGDSYIEFPSFDITVDEYFCKIEEQRMQQQAANAEETAIKKVNKVKAEMENQLKGLITQQEKMETSATLVELYADDIDKACLVINSALSSGVAWNDIDSMIATETAKGNPIASLVSKVLYQKNHMIVKLPNLNQSDSSESDIDNHSSNDEVEIFNNNNNKSKKKNNEKNNKNNSKNNNNNQNFIEVEIDLSLSAYANAAKLYSNKKVAKMKEIKTAQASEKAIDAVEQQTYKQLESQRMKRNLQAVRKVHWFEKFNWFITSEGYLVLSGRDAQQNEALVKKYLRTGDAYVHADMHGASSCIVRAKLDSDSKPLPISPFALQEAGTMTICRSGAWNVKVVMSAWWVHASQVSKTAPTGEYLTTGSFMIYGRKNFLPPTNLEMGFGIMFRLDDSSVTRHLGDRKDKLVDFADDESIISTISDLSERYSIDITPAIPILTTTLPPPPKTTTTTTTSTSSSLPGTILNQDINNDKAKARINRRAQKALEKSQAKNIDNNDIIQQSQSQLSEIQQAEVESEVKSNIQFQDDNNSADMNVEGSVVDNIVESEQIEQEDTNNNKNNSKVENDKNNKNSKNDKKNGKNSNSSSNSKKKSDTGGSNNNNNNNNNNNSSKNQKKGLVVSKDEDSNNDSDSDSEEEKQGKTSGFKKKKAPNKKKARRYAHQDEEDLELAMQALGHKRPGGGGVGTLSERQNQEAEEKKAKEKQQKQAKAGVNLLAEDWTKSLELLQPEVKSAFQELISSGQMKSGEIDSFEISTLASFETNHGLEILRLLNGGGNLSNVKNKSGFLAGIMRRYSSTLTNPTEESSNVKDEINNHDNNNITTSSTVNQQEEISRRERKKKEQMEIQAILEDEGILDEMEGKQADELEKLTGTPLPEDLLLYAVPVCGPYKALQSMKYVVKLTPGTNKKGKAAKQAVEIFMNSKECSNNEKALIKGLTDPEMVAIMIGDVKLSVPGLYSTLKNKKVEKKKSAKEKIKGEE